MNQPRSLEEIKNDIRSRLGYRAPFLHADKTEAEEALGRMNSVQGETWAQAWNQLGARWEEKARAAETAGNQDQAKESYLKSYGYYGIARHPFPSTPGKHHGYVKTREMFLAASKYFEIPVERVSIPFQDKQIIGHLRLPEKVPAPLIMHWGDDPGSHIYVKNKEKACKEVGIRSFEHLLPATVSEKELLALVHSLNKDKDVHGILVQLPLPAHIRSERILEAVSPFKDVDGFHPVSQGMLVIGADGFRPCTPMGVMKLLEAADCTLKGKNAVVVGRSNIVGKPVALMLLEKHATVTICHSRTASLRDEVSRADILVVAIGKAGLIRGDWVKPGAVVVDVGVNQLPSGKLTGDVEFETAKERASAITPVPGGVGPMTICMLLHNTLKAAKDSIQRER